MSLCIVHDLPGRLRLRGGSKPEAALLLRGIALRTHTGVLSIRHSPLAGSLLVLYDPNVLNRGDLLLVLHASLRQEPTPHAVAVPSDQEEEAPTLAGLVLPLFLRPLLPMGLRQALAFRNAWPRLRKGLVSLARGLLDIDVLDAAAIGLCIVRRDFRSLTTITLLLGLGEFLESWTKKRSEQSLADSLAKHSIKANLRQGAIEQQVDAATLRTGDMVIVRQGSFIPADGVVMNGEGLVDQSLMSGEAKLQEKRIGSAVFAGSLPEEGELLIQATEDGDRTVWRRTMLLLHDAVQRKASIQGQAEQLASRLAPFSLLLAVLVFAFTGDPRRAASVLMVDYSCAIKLATPLAILAAMRQALFPAIHHLRRFPMIAHVLPGRIRLRHTAPVSRDELDHIGQCIREIAPSATLSHNLQSGRTLVVFAEHDRTGELLARIQTALPHQPVSSALACRPRLRWPSMTMIKRGMTGSLAASLGLLALRREGGHALTGSLFLLCLSRHLWVYRKRLVK